MSYKIDVISVSSENCKTSDLNRLVPYLVDRINLKRSDKYVALSYLSIYYTWRNMSEKKYIKFEIAAPT